MTVLREKFIEDLKLNGKSDNTVKAYVFRLINFSRFVNKCPSTASDDELRKYFLWMKEIKKYSRSHMTQTLCALKFFFKKHVINSFQY